MVAYQFRALVLEALTGRHWCKRAECAGMSCRSFPLLFFGQSAGGLRGRQLGFDGSHTGVARLSLGVVAVQGFTNSRRRLASTIGLCFDLRYEEEGRVLPLHFTSSCLDL